MPHPDEEIEREHRVHMNALAQALDNMFNPNEKKICFVLLVTKFDDPESRCNYISNGGRKDIVTMMKEVVARFEGQPELKGRA